jgi:hypothetical protein
LGVTVTDIEAGDRERRRVVVSLLAHRDRCEGHEEALVGSYWVDAPREHQHLVETADCCPYCAGALRRLVVAPGVDIWRVIALDGIAVDDRQAVAIDLLPSTHDVLACRPCRQTWTRPR